MTPTLETHEPGTEEQEEPGTTKQGGEEEQGEQEGEEEEAEEEGESAAETEGQTKPSEDAVQALFSRAQKEGEKYIKKVTAMLGEHGSDLSVCPRCGDFMLGLILPPTIKPVAADQAAAVKMSMGEGAPPVYKQDREAFVCPDCDGEGKVETGSHVARERLLVCESCKGRGWVGPRATRAATLPPAGNGQVDADAVVVEEERPQVDPWGRLPDDPNFGILPGYEPV